MEVNSSDTNGDRQKSLTLVPHGSVNGGANWLRFGHCRDPELRVRGVDWDGLRQGA